MTCTNCGKELATERDMFMFEKVPCCKDCYDLAQALYSKSKKRADKALETYRNMLAVAMTRKSLTLSSGCLEELQDG